MITWTQTTETDYWEMLCVLPPERRARPGAFLVGEPAGGGWGTPDTYQAYREPAPGRFEKSAEPVTIAEFDEAAREWAETERQECVIWGR